MVESLLLHKHPLALSSALPSTATIWCVFNVHYPALVTHTGVERPNAIRSTRSRHSVLLSLTLRRASLVISAHRLCRCALSLPHTTLPQQTPPRNSLSRSCCSCVLTNTPSGAVPLRLHEDLCDVQSSSNTGYPREITFADAATQLSFAEFFERCILSKALPPRPQPSPTLLQDASTQASPHSAAFTDASTQLPFTEFFLGCVYSNDPLDRQLPLPSHGNVSVAPLLQPKHTGTTLSFSSSSGGDVRIPVPRTQPNGAPPPPPGLEDQPPLGSPHGIPGKAAPVRPRSQLALALAAPGTTVSSTCTPSLQPQVSTTQVGTHTARSSTTHKRSASSALAGTRNAIGADPRAGRGPFPKPRPLVLPMVSSGQAKPAGLGHVHNADCDLMHHQCRLSILQWNLGPARRNPTQIIAATLTGSQ